MTPDAPTPQVQPKSYILKNLKSEYIFDFNFYWKLIF